MQTNLLWTGREYYSLENCLVNRKIEGSEISSTIVGLYKGKIYKVEYRILTNRKWETLCLEISCRHDDKIQLIKLDSDGKGNWIRDGVPDPLFAGCIDVDIPLTPFTNTLPINRLQLNEGQEHEVKVVYVDLLARHVSPVRQKYVKLSESRYHYENIPNDFEADIEVDEQGFVTDYPLLFVRTAALQSKYPSFS